MIALGASGSGKTFSMGLNNTTSDGMIGLSIDSLLQKLALKHQQADFNVFVSFIEIYKEKVFDLLTNGDESIYSKSKGNKFSGSRKIEIRTSDEASKVLNEGNKNRHTRATSLNSSSSRSHAIVTIYLSIHSDGSEISSLMHFADLAGSEGLRRTKHIGVAQQEGVNINQGLLAIGKVVQAMSNGLQVIPYRESTLTSVLKDSLNTNSYLAILGCISQNDKNETMSTVRFVHSVKSVKNMPEINVHQVRKTIFFNVKISYNFCLCNLKQHTYKYLSSNESYISSFRKLLSFSSYKHQRISSFASMSLNFSVVSSM